MKYLPSAVAASGCVMNVYIHGDVWTSFWFGVFSVILMAIAR